MSECEKITERHLQRRAYVYVRQSTMAQVERNTETGERQYELVERAVGLGWAAEEVVVVDEDRGGQVKSTDGRTAFRGWSRTLASVRWGWSSGLRSRGSRVSTRTGIGCWICAR